MPLYPRRGQSRFSASMMVRPVHGRPHQIHRACVGEAFRILKEKGAKEFGIHAFLASNTVTNEYYPMLAKVLFEQAVRLQKETFPENQYG